jgi:hypothetical protein
MAHLPVVLARFDYQARTDWVVPERLGTSLGSIGYR